MEIEFDRVWPELNCGLQGLYKSYPSEKNRKFVVRRALHTAIYEALSENPVSSYQPINSKECVSRFLWGFRG
jgi:hypothetical protein